LQNYHGIKKLNFDDSTHRELVHQSIVPPPDDSIDIFFEEKDVDECRYHIVQVKNQELTPKELEDCFLLMEHSVNLFLKKPKDLRKNLREIIGNTDFSKQYKNSCTYYVVHRGSNSFIRNQKSNQKIITENELITLEQGTISMTVPKEDFVIDFANNFIVNNYVEKKSSEVNKNIPQSLLCNFNGYDLAKLNNKYINTLLGRNILYGQNLREALSRQSKTFEKMYETIDKEPDLFLYYNNGITIIASSFDAKSLKGIEKITLENFSIINGAQTTSTLGYYLREAEMNNELDKIEKLKKVFVLVKIYQINESLQNSETISERIKIFNNTQTPLSSRDMVSFRQEQINLQSKLFLNKFPNIFVYIKKGEVVPAYPKTYPHQKITNEILAQIALCGFFSEPFNAKDKKNKIFENDEKEGYLLNEIYDKLFSENKGILFQKNKDEIDELLFVYRLHEDSKKIQKKFLKDNINVLNQSPASDEFDRKSREDQINRAKREMEIANLCLFYDITCYYEFRTKFDYLINDINSKWFNIKEYYDKNSKYQEDLLFEFSTLFYSKTIEIIRNLSGVENIQNFLRAEKTQQIFLNELRNYLTSQGYIISKRYVEFVNRFKTYITNN